jgi:hypothetical protein
MSRNTGAGSLLINTKGIRNLTFITEWNPSAGSTAWKTDQSAKKQAAVVIGAGMTWAEVLKVLEVEYKYTTVHGASSVSEECASISEWPKLILFRLLARLEAG